MRVLVIEFITGGGLIGEEIPEGLAHEGAMMIASVIGDLGALRNIHLVATRDERFAPIAGEAAEITVTARNADDHAQAAFQSAIKEADAVLPIAPETDGQLQHLTRLVLEQNKYLLGCQPKALEITTSKSATTKILTDAGLPSVPCYSLSAPLPQYDNAQYDKAQYENGWIIKPDDGAGCEQTFFLPNRDDVDAWIDANHCANDNRILQPYIPGIAASLCLLCGENAGQGVRILACNRQYITPLDKRKSNPLHLQGIGVNELAVYIDQLQPLMERVSEAIPGLWGFVGVDFKMTPDGPVIVEINPRLTTSYVGLGSSIGVNPMHLLWDLLEGRNDWQGQPLQTTPVRITLA